MGPFGSAHEIKGQHITGGHQILRDVQIDTIHPLATGLEVKACAARANEQPVRSSACGKTSSQCLWPPRTSSALLVRKVGIAMVLSVGHF
jgi:hypothetical protein